LIEALPTSNAIDKDIINFLEGHIFSRFGCPKKLVTDNTQDFKSNSMVEFWNNITSNWSIPLLIIPKVMG